MIEIKIKIFVAAKDNFFIKRSLYKKKKLQQY
jgi:hypothetical protein